MKYFITCSLILISFLARPAIAIGQTDTLLNVETIEVKAKAIRESSIATNTQTWSKTALNQTTASNVAELLENESGVFIKSYGAGSLATSSIRGGGAGHTAVLWNGMPIQSPMLGLLDLSLLSLNAAEEVVLQKGGNSALHGSGAIGGVIALNNRPDFDNVLSLRAATNMGSFGLLGQQAKLSFGNKHFQSVTKLSNQQADNDFYYLIAPDLPKRQQSNAALSQQNILQDFYWRPSQKYLLSTHFWRQVSSREIPPTNSQNSSEAYQNDRTSRLLLQAKAIGNSYLLNAKIGFADEHLDYFDDATNLESLSRFISWNAELGAQWHWNEKYIFYVGLSDVFTRAWTEGYTSTPSEHNAAFLASFQVKLKKLQLQASLRNGLKNRVAIPIIPTLALEYSLAPFLNWKMKVSKNYRLPTFNDRYWKPGGNEALLPESGWSEEAALISHLKNSQSLLNISLTAFNRNINNWILWTPSQGQTFWSPSNIAKVWSRGLESQLSYTYQWSKTHLQLTTGYNFIRSTYQVNLSSPSIKKGEQLLYTPRHQAFAKCAISRDGFYLMYRHSYNSASSGINDAIPAYQLGAARIQYTWKKNKFNITTFFNSNNIWNKNYLIIERRLMPGINYELGVRFLFVKKNNQN